MAEEEATRGEVFEGVWIDLDDLAAWKSFVPRSGDVVEFDTTLLGATEVVGEVAAFLVLSVVRAPGDAGLHLAGRFIGSSSEEASKFLSTALNRKSGRVHLCWDSPCAELDVEGLVHATRARWWKGSTFVAPYMSPWGRMVLKEYLEKVDEEAAPADAKKPRAKNAPKTPRRPREGRSRKPGEERKDTEGRGVLKAKLKGLRQQLTGRGKGSGGPAFVDLVGSEEESEEASPSDFVEEESGLVTGERLTGEGTALALTNGEGDLMRRRKQKVRRKKERSEVRKSPADQLLAQAEQARNADLEDKEEKRRKKRKGDGPSGVKALVKLLAQEAGWKDKEKDVVKKEVKERRKGKSARRQRKKRKGQGGGSGPGSSGDSSGSGGASRSSEEEESSSSEMLAPLQKRSVKRPGAVLKMLVDHARAVMDQTALVSTGAAGVTTGVKLASYFSLMIRPYHSSTSRDMKEIHHLSVCLDQLRGGDLGRLGDSLASRFLAIHTAVNDGTWRSAQYLEMNPLEAAQGAPTALLLEARKHGKMVEKSRGAEEWGRRKGEGEPWKWGQSNKGGGKGGKTGKGKESSKGGRNEENWNKGGKWSQNPWKKNWWADNKEKADGSGKEKPGKPGAEAAK